MASIAGAHSSHVGRARELLAVKGRREHGLFLFEGPTLLDEARRSGLPIEEIFILPELYERSPAVRELEEAGTRVHLIDDRVAAKISDLETPTGLVAVAPQQLRPAAEVLQGPLTLILADLNDPGNAGTLLRSGEAFGASGAVLGRYGVDPYHPKVVRSAMGSLFRLPLAVAEPGEIGPLPGAIGLDAGGADLAQVPLAERIALVVGHERRGLGSWESVCAHTAGLPMRGRAESLNAAVAGSVALYELFRRCQDSARGAKSQDFTR